MAGRSEGDSGDTRWRHPRWLAIAAITVVGILVSFPAATQPARAGEVCTDPTPDGGGDLLFKEVGRRPNHYVTRLGDVCPGASDVWTFSTVDFNIEQYVGVTVVQEDGTFTVAITSSAGALVALGPGEEYRSVHSSHPVTYEVTIAGTGDVLARYRLQACRSINEPCVFSEAVTVKPGDVSCDGLVDSVDALLILEIIARIIDDLPCRNVAWANLDGFLNAIDAALILQLDAGLIDRLPIP